MTNLQSEQITKVVLFSLDSPRYALHLSQVDRVVPSMEITPLPGAPKIIYGVVNFHGEIIPVVNIRQLFGLPHREVCVDDQFVIVSTEKRRLVLVVDYVTDVVELSDSQITDPDDTMPFTDVLSGITVYNHHIVLISDLEKFLSLDEQKKLDRALRN